MSRFARSAHRIMRRQGVRLMFQRTEVVRDDASQSEVPQNVGEPVASYVVEAQGRRQRNPQGTATGRTRRFFVERLPFETHPLTDQWTVALDGQTRRISHVVAEVGAAIYTVEVDDGVRV